MDVKGNFIISRKDAVTQTDDVRIETQGLTIGRLIGNDLVLNHRSVSRTHAGIKKIGEEFWIFNLSSSNGTMLNGELVVRVPLADGDTIQIGPYIMRTAYAMDALRITVEMEIEVHPVEGAQPQPKTPSGSYDEGTMIVSMPKIFDEKGQRTIGSARLSRSGMLTGVLPPLDERALNIFWDKRKRESGKISEKTPLQPRGNKKVGKAQFNWSPTLDLSLLRRKSFFVTGAFLIGLFSLGGIFLPDATYSPGSLSSSHTSTAAPKRGIAIESNSASCSSCHFLTSSVNKNCTDCHTTKTFQPTLYDKHTKEGMGCVSCHIEHRGPDIRAGLVSYTICSSCHNGKYTIKATEKAGQILPIPHGGGALGYPVDDNGNWTWKGLSPQEWNRRAMPFAATESMRDQFHLVHQTGRMQDKMKCTDCHTNGTPATNARDNSPRVQCANCHAISVGVQGNNAVRLSANCGTCHQQHGESEDTTSLINLSGTDAYSANNIKRYVATLDSGGPATGPTPDTGPGLTGGAAAIRQQEDSLQINDLSNFGALSWYTWLGVILFFPIAGLVGIGVKTARRRGAATRVQRSGAKTASGLVAIRSLITSKLADEGPSYPHPVIDPEKCIGCHACVEACPHDVLAIVNGIASPVALDQCMEDTGCQVECPTNPKACIVVNTNKKIPERKVPDRDKRFMTGVNGMFLIGDVSGVPLIKNAVNEGAQVIDYIVDEFKAEGAAAAQKADYDVAVIGIGPAGLSAAALAKQRGLRVLPIEQDKIVSTIQAYPAGKYVFFKPDTVEAKGLVPVSGAGETKEKMLAGWLSVVKRQGLDIHEEETCSDIKPNGGCFTITTEKGKAKEKAVYSSRRVILAIGNRGTPMKLGVTGEELTVMFAPDPNSCPSCKRPRKQGQLFCPHCGTRFDEKTFAPRPDPKVKYKLMDPDDYHGKKCIVIGAGNSAIEAAVDLCGFKRDGEKITFVRDNEVSLVIRSDFKGDLKLGNKMNVYDCIDSGKIKLYLGAGIKEITESEVVLMNARSKQETARLKNDYVFALIGGEKPTKFLQSLGVKILG